MSSICVHLDDSSFSAGLPLKGVVVLDVQGSDVTGKALNICLIGQEYCQIEYSDKTERKADAKDGEHDQCNRRRLAKATHEIIRLQACRVDDLEELFLYKGSHGKYVLPQGVHQIPFEIELPESLPGSIHICKEQNPKEHCCIKYHVRAVLEGSGRFWNYQTTQETKIRAKPFKESRPRKPWGRSTEPLTENSLWHPFSWFLSNGGGYFRRIVTVDNVRLKASDTCSIQVKFKNGSNCEIRSIEATLYQTLEWKTNHPRKRYREKQTMGWTGFPLPSSSSKEDETQEEAHEGHDDNGIGNSESASTIDDYPSSTNGVSDHLASLPRAYSVSAPLTVHRDCHPSYEGKILSVCHELVVRIRLKSFWASVQSVTIPIQIGPS